MSFFSKTMWIDFVSKSKLYVSILIYSSCILICLITPFKIMFNEDLGFYLSVSQYVAQGKVLYKDIQLSYPPLSFYIFALLYKIFGNHFNASYALIVLQLFTITNSIILMKILKSFNLSKTNRFYWASLFISLTYISDGRYYILEPIAITFGLYAFYLTLKKTYVSIILVGVFSALAFLTKTYALVFFPINLLLYFVISFKKEDFIFKKLCLYFSAFILSVFFCFLCFYVSSGDKIFTQLFGNGYGSRDIYLIPKGILNLFSNLLIFVILTILFFRKLDFMFKRIVLICLFGIFLFSLQFYFQIFPHYFMFFYPFIIIPSALTFDYLFKKNNKLTLVILLIGSIPIAQNVLKIFIDTLSSTKRTEQYQTMNQVSSIINLGKTVCVYSHSNSYLFSELHLKPVNYFKNKCGFETLEENRSLLKSAKYVLISSRHEVSFKKTDPIAYKILQNFTKIQTSKMVIFINPSK